jgi:hypothetical protein
VFSVGGDLKTRGRSLSSKGANAAVQAERPRSTAIKVYVKTRGPPSGRPLALASTAAQVCGQWRGQRRGQRCDFSGRRRLADGRFGAKADTAASEGSSSLATGSLAASVARRDQLQRERHAAYLYYHNTFNHQNNSVYEHFQPHKLIDA